MIVTHVSEEPLPSENGGEKSCSVLHGDITLFVHLNMTIGSSFGREWIVLDKHTIDFPFLSYTARRF